MIMTRTRRSNVQVAEYLIITALFREGSREEAAKAVTWLVNPQRRFQVRPFTVSARGAGVRPRAEQPGATR